ncbi:TonB-dependent receptor [Olivibacter sp. CPCC 100613]|uniref:TonB-dependent receptor n=1 Tax=Olivibacter sp. CPCC 100613 TaxID=3079931 RepID=UPI002FF5BE7B
MKRTLLFLLFFSVVFFSLSARQRSSIAGQLFDELGQPVIGATIRLEPGTYIRQSDGTGKFHFNDLPQGHFEIIINSLGFEPFHERIKIGSDNMSKKITLYHQSELLQSVEVTGRKEKEYKNSLSYGGTKIATDIKDVPQSIQYITKELMQDQGAVRMIDVVKNVSGINQHTFYDDVTIRGFRNQGGVGSNSSNQLFNGLRTFNGFWRQNLLNYLERVEVIKGPASALFGNVNPGGTINKVTKKPLDVNRRSVNFQVGNYGTMRTNLDFTGPANKDKTILYRLNLGYENANSFRDLMFDKNIVIAPSFSYVPNERTRINLDIVYNKSNSRLDRGQSIFGSNDLYSTPISLNVADINDYLNEETYLITASLSHKLTDHITFNTSYLRTGYRQDLLEHRSTAFAVDSAGNQINTLALRRASQRHNEQLSDSYTAYFSAEAATGEVRHIIVAGYDYNNSLIPVGSSQMDAAGYRLKDGTVTVRYIPARAAQYEFYEYNGQMIPKPNVPSYDLEANKHSLLDIGGYIYAANNTDVVVPFFSQQHSVYVQDQLSFRRLKLLLGLRYDIFVSHLDYASAEVSKVTQRALQPRIGVTYEINSHVNAYATYTTGYNPQDARSQNTLAGGPFDPMKSYLLEAGLKTDWFEKRLSATVSVYDIEQRNALYNAQDPDNPDRLNQIGKDKSRGIEMDIVGSILPNLNVVATYAYNHARLLGASGGTDSLYNNQQKPNAPAHQGSIWTKYQFDSGALKGLGMGGGVYYIGKRSFGFQGNASITPIDAPTYTLLNAALYYRVNKVLLQLNVNNLTNKTHWVGGYDSSRLYPGAPRTWLAGLTYDF